MNETASTLRARARGRRDLFSRLAERTGFNSLLRRLPDRDVLLVLAYHRIGDAASAPFDPDVFSATAGAFDEQMAFVRHHMSPITLDEIIHLQETGSTWRGCRVLITFDDGYLDNYEQAFPVLKKHQIAGVFFLSTAFVGSRDLAWWDQISFIIRNATVDAFTLEYPIAARFDLRMSDTCAVLRRVLALYKRPEAADAARFIGQLREACGCRRPFPDVARPFLDWSEAREMADAGMSIQSHAHTHRLLGRLSPEDQRAELTTSFQILTEQLGRAPVAVAYPVGERAAFTDDTQRLAKEAGYRLAFSLDEGVNRPRRTCPWNVRRIGVDRDTMARFRTQMTFTAAIGRFWP